jgi:hypothetical protein
LSTSISQSLDATCTVPATCQHSVIGDIDFEGDHIKCDTIILGENSSNVDFTCASNQSAAETANIVQTTDNTASAMLGEFADADAEVNMATMLSNVLNQQCGGVPPSEGGGACKTGTVQSTTVNSLKIKDSTLDCTTMDVAMNKSNQNVQCTLSQAAKASETLQQAVKNTAKGVNWMTGLFAMLIAMAMLGVGGIVLKGMLMHHHASTGKGDAKLLSALVDAEEKSGDKK